MRPKRVLIVDDSHIMREQLKKIINNNDGFKVCATVSNALDAMGGYTQYRPDIVTMDINMPNIDGIEGVKMIISIDPDAKIVMCSTEGSKLSVLEAIKAGATSFIVKPFTPETVIEILKSVSDD